MKIGLNNSEIMRRIVFYDADGNRTFVFYTNNVILSAEDIALAYKYRWHVELFFKWVKQHLHVKEFYGTTENAVKIQLYSAISAYCLVAIITSLSAIKELFGATDKPCGVRTVANPKLLLNGT